MQSFIFTIFIVFTLTRFSVCQESEEEDEEFGDCKPVFSHNYGYKVYFNLPKSAFLRNKTIHFPFSVMTSSDAHILFSPTPNPKDKDPVYEMVLGAGWNTYSEIRRLNKYAYRVTNISRGIVNKNAFKKFWINLIETELSMGIDGSETPFIKWKDARPLDIKYISFSSWHGTHAKWYFDCQGSSPVAKNMTTTEKLKKDLFSRYDPYTIPDSDDDSILISNNITINYVNLDPATSSMELIGVLRSYWFDNSLRWNKSNYDNMELLRITERNIWQPALTLFNSATLHQKWFDQGILIITNDGFVDWSSNVHLITRCDIKMTEWPNDSHNCPVYIGLHSDQQSVLFFGLHSIEMASGNHTGNWEITSVKGDSEFMVPPWERALDPVDALEASTSVLTLEISLKRHSSTYYYIFYIPLKATMIISVISFMLPYTCPQRIILHIITLIKLTINLISIDSVLPRTLKQIPHILSLSSGVLMINTICTILTIWLIHCSKCHQPLRLPSTISKLIEFLSLRFRGFIQTDGKMLKINLVEEEEISDSVEIRKVEKQTWESFLILLDYLLLFTILISYLILIVVHYS